jgi:hypothetical protein
MAGLEEVASALREELRATTASMGASVEAARGEARAAEERLQHAQQELVGHLPSPFLRACGPLVR